MHMRQFGPIGGPIYDRCLTAVSPLSRCSLPPMLPSDGVLSSAGTAPSGPNASELMLMDADLDSSGDSDSGRDDWAGSESETDDDEGDSEGWGALTAGINRSIERQFAVSVSVPTPASLLAEPLASGCVLSQGFWMHLFTFPTVGQSCPHSAPVLVHPTTLVLWDACPGCWTGAI